MGQISHKLFLKFIKLRETACPGINLGIFRSFTTHPQTAIIMTKAVVLASRAGGILVHPHNLCFKLIFKKDFIYNIDIEILFLTLSFNNEVVNNVFSITNT